MKKSSPAKSHAKDRRLRIVQAALKCFILHGVVGTSFKQIAEEADVNQPLIGYYFASFEDLFAAVVGLMLEDLKGVTVSAIEQHAANPRQALLAYTEIPIVWAQQKPEYNALWTFFYHLASYQKKFMAINDSIRQGGRERITLLLYRYQEHSGRRLKVDWTVDRLARSLHAQITGAVIIAVTETGEIAQAATASKHSVAALLDAAFELETPK